MVCHLPDWRWLGRGRPSQPVSGRQPGSCGLTVSVGEWDCGWNAMSDTTWGAGEGLTALAELDERRDAAGMLLLVDVHGGGRWRGQWLRRRQHSSPIGEAERRPGSCRLPGAVSDHHTCLNPTTTDNWPENLEIPRDVCVMQLSLAASFFLVFSTLWRIWNTRAPSRAQPERGNLPLLRLCLRPRTQITLPLLSYGSVATFRCVRDLRMQIPKSLFPKQRTAPSRHLS